MTRSVNRFVAVALLAALGSATPARAAFVVKYDIPQTGSGFTSIGPSGTADGVTATSLAAVGALTPNTFGNHFYFSGWSTKYKTTTYFETTITVAAGKQLILTDLTYSVESTSTSGGSFLVVADHDGFSGVVDEFTITDDFVTNHTTNLAALGPITGSVNFRFFVKAPTVQETFIGFANHLPGGPGEGLPDVGQNIHFNGTVSDIPATAVPEPASLVLLGTGGLFALGVRRLRRRLR